VLRPVHACLFQNRTRLGRANIRHEEAHGRVHEHDITSARLAITRTRVQICTSCIFLLSQILKVETHDRIVQPVRPCEQRDVAHAQHTVVIGNHHVVHGVPDTPEWSRSRGRAGGVSSFVSDGVILNINF